MTPPKGTWGSTPAVYRMGRIEELTGRKLNDTADVAELWLALRANEMIG